MVGSIFGVGGITRHVLGLRDWLVARGHVVHLAGTGDAWAGRNTDPDFLEIPTLKVTDDGGPLPARLGNAALAAWRLRRWLSRHRVDVIHCHESAPALVALLARVGMGIPVVVTYHGAGPDRIAAFGAIAKRADLVITPSHASARDLATIGGVDEAKLKVVGLGVQAAPPDDPGRRARLRREVLGDGTHLIVTVARMTYQKGIDILIDCIDRLRDRQPGMRFVVAGTGPLESEMHALAAERGLDNGTLIFVGHTEEPHLYLRAADLFLLTSRWEALPFTIVEAFQTGTPTVATACSGVVELIDDSVGAVVPVGDTEAICSMVEALILDPDRRRAMSDAARARSTENRFDPEWVHTEFETIYHGLRSHRAARPDSPV